MALARAVIRDPAVLLLDEPLSAIDEQFREEMRWELGHLQRELGVTTIYVTHDQREAMSLADRIVLMSDGRIVQVADAGQHLLRHPDDVFAGQFIGSPSMNLIDLVPVEGGLRLGDSDVTLTAGGNRIPRWAVAGGRKLKLGVRPLNVHLRSIRMPASPFRCRRCALGRSRALFQLPHRPARPSGRRQAPFATSGPRRAVHFAPEGLLFFDAATGRRVTRRLQHDRSRCSGLQGLKKILSASSAALRGLDLDSAGQRDLRAARPDRRGQELDARLPSAGLIEP